MELLITIIVVGGFTFWLYFKVDDYNQANAPRWRQQAMDAYDKQQREWWDNYVIEDTRRSKEKQRLMWERINRRVEEQRREFLTAILDDIEGRR